MIMLSCMLVLSPRHLEYFATPTCMHGSRWLQSCCVVSNNNMACGQEESCAYEVVIFVSRGSALLYRICRDPVPSSYVAHIERRMAYLDST